MQRSVPGSDQFARLDLPGPNEVLPSLALVPYRSFAIFFRILSRSFGDVVDVTASLRGDPFRRNHGQNVVVVAFRRDSAFRLGARPTHLSGASHVPKLSGTKDNPLPISSPSRPATRISGLMKTSGLIRPSTSTSNHATTRLCNIHC